MLKRLSVFFGAVMIGTILFWVTSLGIFELWINDQPESMERGRIEIDPVTGEKRIYIEEKTVYKEEIIPHPDSERYQESYLKSEQKFGKLKIGKPMPKGISMLDFESIPDSSFYVYVQRRGFSICEFDTCDIADAGVVQCMEGWLTGDEYPEAPHLLGLDSLSVSQGKASMVLVLDENELLEGIFPFHTEADILPILGTFPKYQESLRNCIDEEIGYPPSIKHSFPSSENIPSLSGAQTQSFVKKAQNIAIVMPDGSIQNAKGQTMYELFLDKDKNSYSIYRPNNNSLERDSISGDRLVFPSEADAINWMKERMRQRGYDLVNF